MDYDEEDERAHEERLRALEAEIQRLQEAEQRYKDEEAERERARLEESYVRHTEQEQLAAEEEQYWRAEQERVQRERDEADLILRQQADNERLRIEKLQLELEALEREQQIRYQETEQMRRLREQDEEIERLRIEAEIAKRQRDEDERRQLEDEAELRRQLTMKRLQQEEEELRRLKQEEEQLEILRVEEAKKRRQSLPARHVSARNGSLYVSHNPLAGQSTNAAIDLPVDLVNLDGATVSKAIDPIDGSHRILINYKADEVGNRERLIIEPHPKEFDIIMGALEMQIQNAQNMKAKWKMRSYDLLPRYLRVFVGEGDEKVHEMDIDLATATAEPVRLPNKPYCVRVKPNLPDGRNTAILMEADSPVEQEIWYHAIQKEIDVSSHLAAV